MVLASGSKECAIGLVAKSVPLDSGNKCMQLTFGEYNVPCVFGRRNVPLVCGNESVPLVLLCGHW